MPAKASSFFSVLSSILVDTISMCARMQKSVNRLHTGLTTRRGDRGTR